MGLFSRKREPTRLLVVHLNARLQPMHRGEHFEDPLESLLSAGEHTASVVGGGTELSDEYEPLSCDIEVEFRGEDPDAIAADIAGHLDSLGAPRGSVVRGQDGNALRTFGSTDGLALYLNGTDLPDDVYANSDVNELIDALQQALGDSGRMLYWEGPRDTALFLYGPHAETMRNRLKPLLSTRPDAQLSRVEAIT